MLKRFWTWFVVGDAPVHQWTPWTIVEEGDAAVVALFAVPMVQSRRCITCGWTERRSYASEDAGCYSRAERAAIKAAR